VDGKSVDVRTSGMSLLHKFASLSDAWLCLSRMLFDEDTSADEYANARLMFYFGASVCSELLNSNSADVQGEMASFFAQQESTDGCITSPTPELADLGGGEAQAPRLSDVSPRHPRRPGRRYRGVHTLAAMIILSELCHWRRCETGAASICAPAASSGPVRCRRHVPVHGAG
jgi:hypothetical protein